MASQICTGCGAAVPLDNTALHQLRCPRTAPSVAQSLATQSEEWECSQCTFLNSPEVSICGVCNLARTTGTNSSHRGDREERSASSHRVHARRPPRSVHEFHTRVHRSMRGPMALDTSMASAEFANFMRVAQAFEHDMPQRPQQRLQNILNLLSEGELNRHQVNLSSSLNSTPEAELVRMAMEVSGEDHLRPRPANPRDVHALPTCVLDARQLESLPEEAKECTICMESFREGDELRTLPCLHRFHAGCVDRWFQEQAKCPICKHSLEDDYEAP